MNAAGKGRSTRQPTLEGPCPTAAAAANHVPQSPADQYTSSHKTAGRYGASLWYPHWDNMVDLSCVWQTYQLCLFVSPINFETAAQHYEMMYKMKTKTSSAFHKIEWWHFLRCGKQPKTAMPCLFRFRVPKLTKLEALGQRIPPLRHVLPVSRYGSGCGSVSVSTSTSLIWIVTKI